MTISRFIESKKEMNVFKIALKRELENLQSSLKQATGGKSVCEIHKHGKPTLPFKHIEGKEVVFREVFRSLEKDSGEGMIAELLCIQKNRFEKILASKVGQAADWQEYAKGGLKGVQEIQEMLKAED